MSIVICPGIHPSGLTQQFLAGLGTLTHPVFIFPTDRHPAYSGWHVAQFLQSHPAISEGDGVLLIGFSAGVVGAIGAATLWQGWGGTVKALIAIDGWGVPLFGKMPIYRISHDAFTHWSSALLGAGHESFYAEPPVAHLELWRSPQKVCGWRVNTSPTNGLPAQPSLKVAPYTQTTAAHFINDLLFRHYER
ncbi:hypothetical protein C7B61_15095 [filamentous cyanobacterium CCP1]|nr:hypothetical protein C7B76_19205 [filamentous cyanobacterium CCP2]PSB62028.1 hypothetical protein C7B61_15095 [filamentous cyanobacterium CCP1]